MSTKKDSFVFINKVVDRMSERKDMFSVAMGIAGYSVAPLFDKYTEQDVGTVCMPSNPGQPIFNCGNAFDCSKLPLPSGFVCT